MEEKEKKPIAPADEKTAETLEKVLNPEGEIEIPVGDGRRDKVYWARSGFRTRGFLMAYTKKVIKEAEKIGILSLSSIKNGKLVGKMDGENTTFGLEHPSVKEETLRLNLRGKPLSKDSYIYSIGLLFFSKPPSPEITVDYDYYDEESYREIVNNATTCMLIYLCVRRIDEHKERYFSSPDEVGDRLTMLEAGEITTIYLNKMGLKEDDLKNL